MPNYGRPSIYDYEKFAPILDKAIEDRTHVEALPHLLDIGRSTFYRWITAGDQDYKPEFAQHVERVKAARDVRMLELIDHIAATGQGNSGAATLMLKNTVGWRDRQEVVSHNTTEGKTEVIITIGGGARPELDEAHGEDSDQP